MLQSPLSIFLASALVRRTGNGTGVFGISLPEALNRVNRKIALASVLQGYYDIAHGRETG